MRQVVFENKEYNIKLSAKNYVELQKELSKQLLNFAENKNKAQDTNKKIGELLSQFESEANDNKRDKIARKIKTLEQEIESFNVFVQSFNTLYLYLLAYSMLEDIDGNKPYESKEQFIQLADLEEIKKIEDDLESVFRMMPKEEYLNQKKQAQRKEARERKKKLKSIQTQITSEMSRRNI